MFLISVKFNLNSYFICVLLFLCFLLTQSWSFIFYILSFAWMILKGIFWLLTVLTGRTWEAFEFYVLYWVPVPLEICSFMLVPLFFVNMLYPRRWNDYKIYIRPVYIAVTCGLTILTIMW